MNTNQLYSYLFSFCTEHWVVVDLPGGPRRLKFIPLSLKEKISISNMYNGTEGEKVSIIRDSCKLMLKKAYGDAFNEDSLPPTAYTTIYTTIIEYIMNKQKEIESLYSTSKTPAIKASPNKDHVLNPLISICALSKELAMSLEDLANLDEISLFCLMIFLSETNTRESNAMEEARNK